MAASHVEMASACPLRDVSVLLPKTIRYAPLDLLNACFSYDNATSYNRFNRINPELLVA